MSKKLLTTTLVGLLAMQYANADNSHAYISADVGYTNIQNWWSGSVVLTANVGYQFNDYVASEVGATWIKGIIANYPATSITGGTYGENQSFFDIAAKGSLPFSDIFTVYLKGGLGVGISQTDAVSSGHFTAPATGGNLGLYLAMGGELKLSHNWQLIVEDYGLMPFVGNSWGNINILGAGFKYNF